MNPGAAAVTATAALRFTSLAAAAATGAARLERVLPGLPGLPGLVGPSGAGRAGGLVFRHGPAGHLGCVTDPWPPPRVLREYAFIADGERGALIGPDGSIPWLCAPRWDSPAVFASLLGGRGGYAVTPADPWYVWGGYYDPGTLIWNSRWVGAAVTECREALARPADPHRAVILRRVVAREGRARVRVSLDLHASFGRAPVRDLAKSRGIWTGRSGSVRFRLAGAARARPAQDGQSLAMTLTVDPGERHDLVLEVSDRDLGGPPPDPGRAWAATRDAWSAVVPDCSSLIAVSDARQAYAVLSGLTSRSGAMVAAATTSLPERLESIRNYDYRYAWIRDQCYTGLAVAAHGPHPLLHGAAAFITERLLADGPRLMPAYTVSGDAIPAEHALRVRGYPGGAATRTGNRVRDQFQLDALGEALQLLAAAARLDMAGPDTWRAAQAGAAAIEQRWTEPDAGLWELEPQRWAHSRLACAAGLRAIAAVAARSSGGEGRGEAGRWSSLADQVMASLADVVHPSGRWQRAPGDERVDAALLLPVIRGAAGPADPRVRATVDAITGELSDDGFVYRFRHDARPLHQAEGAFLLCGLWMALAAHAGGDPVAAAHWFERNRSSCGPAGLYTEEYDVHQRQLRGNLPQAFVHAGVLECAVTLSRDLRLGTAG
jgi:GH15 family glucan-1,4-alpha-glucosidase